MAALDWETVVQNLQIAIETTDYAEAAIGEALIANMASLGTPYDAAYTTDVDTQKALDAQTYSDALADWETETEQVHDQTMKVVWYAEDELGGSPRSANIVWSTLTSSLAANKAEMTSIIDNRAADARKLEAVSGVGVNPPYGLSDMLISFKMKFLAAYNSQPVLTYTGSYGEDRTVNAPGIGAITVAKAEELLQAMMNEANQLIADIAFVP